MHGAHRLTGTCSCVGRAFLLCLKFLQALDADSQLHSTTGSENSSPPAGTKRHADEACQDDEAAVGYNHAEIMQDGMPYPILSPGSYLQSLLVGAYKEHKERHSTVMEKLGKIQKRCCMENAMFQLMHDQSMREI